MFLLLIANCENEKGQLKNADLYIFQKNVTLFERFWKRRGPRFQSDWKLDRELVILSCQILDKIVLPHFFPLRMIIIDMQTQLISIRWHDIFEQHFIALFWVQQTNSWTSCNKRERNKTQFKTPKSYSNRCI